MSVVSLLHVGAKQQICCTYRQNLPAIMRYSEVRINRIKVKEDIQ
jgi:hypothetical protein